MFEEETLKYHSLNNSAVDLLKFIFIISFKCLTVNKHEDRKKNVRSLSLSLFASPQMSFINTHFSVHGMSYVIICRLVNE